ncbi:hypothetical protein L1887_28036 [Cichorium endivia]|nr:hypothetical protein L1887_28036 [Cichorium endivia]
MKIHLSKFIEPCLLHAIVMMKPVTCTRMDYGTPSSTNKKSPRKLEIHKSQTSPALSFFLALEPITSSLNDRVNQKYKFIRGRIENYRTI